jgi:hypothetical protein
MIMFETSTPNKKYWYASHDGTKLNLFWPEGKGLPGRADDKIESIYQVYSFPPDTMLAMMKLEGEEMGIFRIQPNQTECVIKVGEPHPLYPEKKIVSFHWPKYRELYSIGFFQNPVDCFWAGGYDEFAIRVAINKSSEMAFFSYNPDVLLYNKGQWHKLINDISNWGLSKEGECDVTIDQVFFPCPRKPIVLFDAKITSSEKLGHALCILDNNRLLSIPISIFEM